MADFKLPVMYSEISHKDRRAVREQYIREQGGLCMFCKHALDGPAPVEVTSKEINWQLFPPLFLRYPIHLQHDHDTGLTEGAVHAYCNAVMWQYHGR